MRLLRFWRVGLGASIALSVSLAFATDPVSPYAECTHKPTPADLDGAKGAHKAASQFYDRGDYDKAIRYWTDAYGFDCTAHGVLINIANAYEKQGDKASAVTALETFLKRAGNDPTIEEKVRNLKQSLAPPPPVTASASASAAPIPRASASASATPIAPHTGPKPFGYTPFIVAGSGAGLAIIGGILLGVGTGAVSKADKDCPTRNKCYDDAVIKSGNRGRYEQGFGATGLVVGFAAIGGGLAWEFLFNKPRPAPPHLPSPKASLQVLPVAGPRENGLTISGSF